VPLNPADQLLDHLNLVRVLAGNPSTGELVHAGAGRLAEQATGSTLSFHGGQLPPWEFVAAYVAACHAAAFAMGRHTQHLGTLPAWRAFYVNLSSGGSEILCPLASNCDYCMPGLSATQSVVMAELPQRLRSQREGASLDHATLRLIENKAGNLASSYVPPGTTMLLVLSDHRRGSAFMLDRDRLVLGRDPKCDIFLDNTYISRRHAEFIEEQDGFVVRDLTSMCGTFVNGTRIDAGVNVPLRNRDLLEVGALKIIVLKKTSAM
jgi:hypothetical protein